MNLRLDDEILEPDAFLKRALEAKLEWLSKRIEELLVTGKHQEEIERLSAARAEFMEVLRAPRLYLSKPAASMGSPRPAPTATPAASTSTPSASPFETPVAAAVRTSFLPKGAIPEPRRFSAPTTSSSPPPASASSARAPSMPAASSSMPPSRPSMVAPSSKSGGGGMMSFLKSVQQTAAAQPVAPTPASAPAPAPVAPPTSTPARPAASPGAGGAKGPMLSFLEKMKQSAAPTAAVETPPSIAAAAETGVISLLKERAAASGFKDVYEMLEFKRARLVESMAAFQDTPAAEKIRAVVEEEIREIDELMKLKPTEIVGKVKEFKEVAAVDKGGLAAIQEEISGLLDEIK